jgi:hypothetical protein
MPQLVAPTEEEIEAWELETRDVRYGEHPRETYEVDNTTVQRAFFCLWEYRFEVVNWLLGQSTTYTDGSTTYLSRLPPQTVPGRDKIACTKVTEITGHEYLNDDEDGMPVYSKAKITALYQFVPFDLLTDDEIVDPEDEINRFVSWPDETETAGEFLAIPSATGLKFKANAEQAGSGVDGRAVPANAYAIVQPSETFVATWHMLPGEAWEPGSGIWNRVYGESVWLGGADIPYQGTINTHTIFGRPPGTVLFARVRPRRQSNPDGTGFWWSLQFEFHHRSAGWNYLYQYSTAAGESGYYYVTNDDTLHDPDDTPDFTSLYNGRDHRLLFSVDAV